LAILIDSNKAEKHFFNFFYEIRQSQALFINSNNVKNLLDLLIASDISLKPTKKQNFPGYIFFDSDFHYKKGNNILI